MTVQSAGLQEFQVGDAMYATGLWPVDKAMRNWSWLVRMVGEPIAAMVGDVDNLETVKTSLMDTKLDGDMFAKAFRALASKMDDNEIAAKMREFTDQIHCNGKPIEYNTHFMGKPGLLFRVVIGCLRVQYRDFFDGTLGAIVSKAADTTPDAPM